MPAARSGQDLFELGKRHAGDYAAGAGYGRMAKLGSGASGRMHSGALTPGPGICTTFKSNVGVEASGGEVGKNWLSLKVCTQGV
jgi:hypothetical protein